MRRPIFLAVGVVGLLVAIGLAGLLTVRRAPSLMKLKPIAGVTVAGPAIVPGGRAGAAFGFGWCAGLSRPLAAGQAVTAWTDVDALGRTRVWRIEQSGRPVCRFTESTVALTASNRRLRLVALAAAAMGLLAFAGLLLDARRRIARG